MSTTASAGRPTAEPLRHPERATPEVRVRRAVVLVLLTLLVPGSAQLAAGNRARGRHALRTWLGTLGVLVLLGLLALVDRSLVIGLFTRSWTLLLLFVALVVLGLGWALLFLDSWRLGVQGGLDRPARRMVTLVTVGCLALTSGPLLYAAALTSAQRDLIGTVFGGGRALEAVDGRYNVLLLGGDAGADRMGLRPDSIQLASIDADTGQTVLVALPRNLAGVPFPDDSPMATVYPDGFDDDEGLLNAVYTEGAARPELYPDAADPGAEATKDAVEAVTGLQVQYSVLVDMQGFSALIDALGGIEVDVGSRVPIGGGRTPEGDPAPITGWIEPGRQTMDGFTALWYARSREGSSDYERMARQRCVMSAMIGQLDPATVLLRFQDIAAASSALVRTDIPQSALGDLADLALSARTYPVVSLQLVPPLVTPGEPDFGEIRELVDAAVAAAEEAPQQEVPAGEAGAPEPPAEEPPDEAPVDEAPGDEAPGDDLAAVCVAG